MGNEKKKGRVTIPTDVDVVKETLDLVDRWVQMQSVIVTVQTIRKSFEM